MKEWIAYFGEIIVITAVSGLIYHIAPEGAMKKHLHFVISLCVLVSLAVPIFSIVTELPEIFGKGFEEVKEMEDKMEKSEEILEEVVTDASQSAQENTQTPEEEIKCEPSDKKSSDKKKQKKLEAECAELTKAKEALEGELAEANDKYARLFAEYDNYRKRSAKEREGVYTDAYIDAIEQILPVLDNMERALQYKDAQGDAEDGRRKHMRSSGRGLRLHLRSL